MMINWNCKNPADFNKIVEVVKRAENLCKEKKLPFGKRSDAIMDVTACHCNGNPLDLDRMLTAPEFDFLHDMFGICRHMNRETGKLMDCFVPRLSLREKVAV